jgi:hypothetical protein
LRSWRHAFVLEQLSVGHIVSSELITEQKTVPEELVTLYRAIVVGVLDGVVQLSSANQFISDCLETRFTVKEGLTWPPAAPAIVVGNHPQNYDYLWLETESLPGVSAFGKSNLRSVVEYRPPLVPAMALKKAFSPLCVGVLMKDNGYSGLYENVTECLPFDADAPSGGLRRALRYFRNNPSVLPVIFPEGGFNLFSSRGMTGERYGMSPGFINLAKKLGAESIYVTAMSDCQGFFSEFSVAVIDRIRLNPFESDDCICRRVRDSIVHHKVQAVQGASDWETKECE